MKDRMGNGRNKGGGRWMKKLRNNRGETLIEVLASVLIATLSVTLLFSCVATASRLDRGAEGLDEKHYNALSDAESYTAPTPDPAGPAPSVNVTIARMPAAPEPEVPDPSLPEPEVPDPSVPGPDPEPEASMDLPVAVYGGEGMYSYRRSGEVIGP